jgi:shikimate dehydrogenase
MPYKEACVEHMDELDGSAEAIGSVNTIVNTGGRLRAYNTDYLAVVKLLADRQVPADRTFAVLGSGGMAKAVVAALRDVGLGRPRSAGPSPCPADPGGGEYGGIAMRLRPGRARLLGGLVGVWLPGQGR